jgi:YebC/PmpR family DNA-binding regulatory protein
MGAQWKHAGRVSNSSKRSALVGKLVKEIAVAAKMGDPNPDNNPRLRAGVEAAKKNSVPRDTIERAIKKGAGLLDDGVSYETIVFEGFAPHQVPVIVECLTDNRNRTNADIRVIFRKGQIGNAGSVAWMFNRAGVIEGNHPDKTIDRETVAIEAGAQEVEVLEAADTPEGTCGARFICDPKDLDSVSKFLTQNQWTITQAELSYLAKNSVEVDSAKKQEVIEFLGALDDCDDVHRIYTALK